jgi:hypothetical protein
MAETEMPAWLAVLDDEDRQFLKRFLLASGSLKDLATQYGISYPTVRSRIDRLIAKVRAVEDPRPIDDFERKLRILMADGAVSLATAKELLAVHRASIKKESPS